MCNECCSYPTCHFTNFDPGCTVGRPLRGYHCAIFIEYFYVLILGTRRSSSQLPPHLL